MSTALRTKPELRCVPSTGTAVRLALVIPLHGPAGIFGPSCEACAQLAVEDFNLGSGVLGRELHLSVIDGSAAPHEVADKVEAAVSAGLVDGVTGWHLSSVRQAIVPRIGGRIPYVYTTLYEGGEGNPGVFLAGETPRWQVQPAIHWLAREKGVHRWLIVGNDYVWPRGTAGAACHYVRSEGGVVCGEFFVPLNTQDFGPAVRRVERSLADAVLMLLVGQDAVLFNRAFAKAGLDEHCLRFSPLMDENMLLASGARSTRDLYAAAGYFDTLPTADNLDFHKLYLDRFGPTAPTLNSMGESCYEGILLFAALAERSGGVDLPKWRQVADTVGYDGPRGAVWMHHRHLRQRIYLAEAKDLEFTVIAVL
jgi:ABC-type branched-subunit amino acid transport system substrate-binding protein